MWSVLSWLIRVNDVKGMHGSCTMCLCVLHAASCAGLMPHADLLQRA